jgi:hypothetical protein
MELVLPKLVFEGFEVAGVIVSVDKTTELAT